MQGSPSKSAHRSRRSRHATPRRGPTPGPGIDSILTFYFDSFFVLGISRAQSTESSLAMIGMNGGTGSGSGKAGVREDLEDLDGLELDVNSNGHV